MAKSGYLGIRISDDEKAALFKAAEADQRAISAMARKVLAEWLRKHGWLKKDTGTNA